MSQFPNQLDSDVDLPRVDNNITEIGADAINALRDAMFSVEAEIGLGGSGTAGSIANRINGALSADGTKILPSALAGIGLVTLPITDSEISPTAEIQESKLKLTYTTVSLYNLYTLLKNSIDVLNGFLSLTGIKLEPHIDGTAYNHLLSAIHVDPTPQMLKTNPSTIAIPGTNVISRNVTNANTLIKDISDDLLLHEKANGSSESALLGGTIAPINYAHVAAGIFIDSSSFSTIPQTNTSLQQFAEFVDSSSLLLLGSRTQNLFSDGISRTSRSSMLTADGYGSPLVAPTPAIAYLLGVPPGPVATSPVDDINHGDDVILFAPTAQQLSTFNFDAQFAQVKPGDILTINYGNGLLVQFVVESTKAIVSGLNRTYAVRVNGKNLFSSSNASARIDRPAFHRNKYGVLASARSPNSIGELESLIIAHPRSAIVLGNGFNPSQLDSSHYNLYLALFPTGDPTFPQPAAPFLPAIDMTGNQGATPGQYTLDSVIDAANTAFRAPGFNYRFIAFQYNGQFGIMLADPYNAASFSIISGTVDTTGSYTSSSNSGTPSNVVDNFNGIDPLGIGALGSNLASPSPAVSYNSVNAARFAPTLMFYPLSRNFFYTNGVERDRLRSDPLIIDQISDSFGDGYWPATILPAPATQVLPGRVEVVYQINLDLSTSGLEVGKTIVVQPDLATSNALYNFRDYGRFTIKTIAFSNCNTANAQTNITVYDGVHGAGVSPAATTTNIPVKIYFSDDSVAFNVENVFDANVSTPYKRFFEIYVNSSGHTFTHERARFTATGSDIGNINFYKVSPKLRGYPTNNDLEIRLTISTYDQTTGIFSGFLSRSTLANAGPVTTGKKGEIVRFYDETNVDYIDFIFTISDTIASFSSRTADIQLFPSIQLDQEMMVLSTCQVNDINKKVSYLKDERQFGNTSEEQFTSSAINFINTGNRLLNSNGVLKGFDISSITSNKISITGGTALVNGVFVNMNNDTVVIPAVNELYASVRYNINWALCVDKNNDFIVIPLTDFDSVLVTPSSNTRIVNLINYAVATPTGYPVDSSTFSNIINNRKDLALLYVISSTVTGTGVVSTSLVSADARKFINDGNSVLPITWTSDNAQGNFKTLAAINSWLKYNGSFNNKVVLKGTFNISSPITLDYSSLVEFEGDGAVLNVSSAIGVILGSNVSLKNIQFNYLYTALGDGNYNAANLVNSSRGLIHCTVSSSLENSQIIDCEFNYTTKNVVDRYPYISIESNSLTASIQNINIVDNVFITTTTNNADDIRAAIAFINNETSGDLTKAGPRLEKCNINNNLCDKNQMIIISSDVTSLNMLNALTPISVKIDSNICGAICFAVRSDTPTNFGNATFISDKYNTLVISNNNCKYIGTTGSDGTTNASIQIYTAPVDIIGNICSWVHLTIGANSTALKDKKGTIRIIDNQFNAFTSIPATSLAVFLANYDSGTNTAISVANGHFNNDVDVIIDKNIIRSSEFIDNTTALIVYKYFSGIYCEFPSLISGNIFNDLNGVTGCTFITQTSPNSNSATITKNRFYRGSTNITSYIDCQNIVGSSHIITDNFFDSRTIDGGTTTTSETLVIGISNSTIYEKNKNQTGYALLPLYKFQNTGNDFGYAGVDSFIHVTAVGDFGTNFSNNWPNIVNPAIITDVTFNNISGSGDTGAIYLQTNLREHLPDNVKVINVVAGLINVSSNTTPMGNDDFPVTSATTFFQMTLNQPLSPKFNMTNSTTLLNSLADVFDIMFAWGSGNYPPTNMFVDANGISTDFYVNSSTVGGHTTYTNAQFASATRYLTVDTTNHSGDKSENFTVSSTNDIVLSFTFQVTIANNFGPHIAVSPIMIKYVW